MTMRERVRELVTDSRDRGAGFVALWQLDAILAAPDPAPQGLREAVWQVIDMRTGLSGGMVDELADEILSLLSRPAPSAGMVERVAPPPQETGLRDAVIRAALRWNAEVRDDMFDEACEELQAAVERLPEWTPRSGARATSATPGASKRCLTDLESPAGERVREGGSMDYQKWDGAHWIPFDAEAYAKAQYDEGVKAGCWRGFELAIQCLKDRSRGEVPAPKLEKPGCQEVERVRK